MKRNASIFLALAFVLLVGSIGCQAQSPEDKMRTAERELARAQAKMAKEAAEAQRAVAAELRNQERNIRAQASQLQASSAASLRKAGAQTREMERAMRAQARELQANARELASAGRAQMSDMWVGTHNGETVWTFACGDNGGDSFSVRTDGDIELGDDDKSIKSISAGGYLEITKVTFGNKRRVRVEGESDGSLTYTYWEGGSKKDFEPDGRKFMEAALLEMVRSSAVFAEGRVNRIYKEDGVEGVLEEIDDLESDYVQAAYYKHLMEIENLKENELKAIIEQMPEDIESDFEVARTLMGTRDRFMVIEDAQDAYLGALMGLDSDFEKTRVLNHVIEEYAVKAEVLHEVLESIDSDFEKTRVITHLFKEQEEIDEEAIESILEISSRLDSDFEKNRVYMMMLDEIELGGSELDLVLEGLHDMDSDFEKGRFLLKLSSEEELGDKSLTRVIDELQFFSSDFERGRVLMSMLKAQKFSDASVEAAISTLDEMGSDFEKSRVIAMMVREVKISDGPMIKLLEVVDSFDSDFEKARTLTVIINEVGENGSNKVKDKMREVAKGIDSDHEYGRVARMLDNLDK